MVIHGIRILLLCTPSTKESVHYVSASYMHYDRGTAIADFFQALREKDVLHNVPNLDIRLVVTKSSESARWYKLKKLNWYYVQIIPAINHL